MDDKEKGDSFRETEENIYTSHYTPTTDRKLVYIHRDTRRNTTSTTKENRHDKFPTRQEQQNRHCSN